MNTLLISMSAISGLILTSTAISLFALYRAHLLVRGVNRRHGEPGGKNRGDIQELRVAVEALAAQAAPVNS